jgi:SAM-dependent methyltransferase
MASGGSYRLREHYRDVGAELARLEAQAAHIWPKEAEVLRRRGFPIDGRLLEVGCGPGFLTERLLELVGNGSVTAIDNDPEMVALARRRVGGLDRVEVLEGSVHALEFADATFERATARLVLQHLHDPEAALAELQRVLRPGGRLFITDVDGGWQLLLHPEPPHLDEVAAAFERLRSRRGGNPKIGRLLPRLLLDAGFADLALDVVAIHSVIDGPQSIVEIIAGMATLERVATEGLIGQAVYEDVRDYVERFERRELQVDGLLATLLVSGTATGQGKASA